MKILSCLMTRVRGSNLFTSSEELFGAIFDWIRGGVRALFDSEGPSRLKGIKPDTESPEE